MDNLFYTYTNSNRTNIENQAAEHQESLIFTPAYYGAVFTKGYEFGTYVTTSEHHYKENGMASYSYTFNGNELVGAEEGSGIQMISYLGVDNAGHINKVAYSYIQRTSELSYGVTKVDTTKQEVATGSKLYIKVENGTISLAKYNNLTISVSGLTNVEIDTVVGETTLTPNVGGTGKNTATVTWSATGGTITSGFTQTTYNEISKVTPSGTPTTCKVTASADDGTTSASASTTMNFYPRIMWGASSNDITSSIEITTGNMTYYNYSVQANHKITNKLVPLASEGYIYYACPSNYSPVFYISSTSSKASLSGGFKPINGTFIKYTYIQGKDNQRVYKLYRTTEKQAAGNYRIDVE